MSTDGLGGGANPPYPLRGFGIFGAPKLLLLLLMLDDDVPGRSFPSIEPLREAAEGRRTGSKGLEILLMASIRSFKLRPGFVGGFVGSESSSPSPPYPPGLADDLGGGGGELFAILGAMSSPSPAPGPPFGVNGDTLFCDPLELLSGVSCP
jgi:hypothetical protein